MQDWVQLNYDGLAQKAGCPQEALMEVVIMLMLMLMIMEVIIMVMLMIIMLMEVNIVMVQMIISTTAALLGCIQGRVELSDHINDVVTDTNSSYGDDDDSDGRNYHIKGDGEHISFVGFAGARLLVRALKHHH